MSLPGEEKEIRMQPSTLSYNNNSSSNNLNHPQGSPVAATPGISRLERGSKTRPSSYRECLKNHAAGIGRTVTDGCCEFMPCGDSGTLEALKCAACGCHRNFHRKDNATADHPPQPSAAMVHPIHLPPRHWSPMAQPVKMAFGVGVGVGVGGSAAGTDSSSEDLNFNAYGGHDNSPVAPPPPFVAKKRFRTKFTAGQKDRMLDFAEKLGWRIPREDDAEVQRFCAEVGVKRQVFKVWMHNNKSASKKPPPEQIRG